MQYDKSFENMEINFNEYEEARSRLLDNYLRTSVTCVVMGVAFVIMTLAEIFPSGFSKGLQILLAGYVELAACWYAFLYLKLKRMDISGIDPSRLLSESARIRLLTYSGETVFMVGSMAFFALFLNYLFEKGSLTFWFGLAVLIFCVVRALYRRIPEYKNLFLKLNGIKE